MKIKLLSLLLAVYGIGKAQSTGPFAIWEDQANSVYKFVRLDAATGVKTNINNILGITGFVAASKSAINPHKNYYHFAGQNGANARFYTLDISTGSVVYNPIITDNVVGIEYNYIDSLLYGIRVAGNLYSFCTLDPVTAQASVIANINMTGYVSGSFSLDLANGLYNFIALTVNGYWLKSINTQGVVVHNNAFPDNVVGHRYNCLDSTVYGLWEINNAYTLEKINFVNGTHTTVDTLAGVTPGYVSESHSMNENGMYTFRGFNGPNFAIISVDASNASVVSMNNTSDNAIGFEESVCLTATDVRDIDSENSFSVFPNPSSGNFEIRNEKLEIKNIEVCDVMGKGIKIRNPESLILNLEIPNGIYFLLAKTEKGNITKKIIINK